jgi:hypothetical protein
MDSPDRNRRNGRGPRAAAVRFAAVLLAAHLLGGAVAGTPLSAQATPDMQPALDALSRALREKNFEILAPYLDDAYRVGSLPAPAARQALAQVVSSGAFAPSAIHVESAVPEGENLRVSARFAMADASRTVGLLLTPAGKFVEIPLFRVAAPGGGPPPPGVQVRAGGTAAGGAGTVVAAPPDAGAPVANPALRDELLAMKEADQRYRREIMERTPPGTRPAPDPETLRLMRQTDSANLERLTAIIDQHGWPGVGMVGQDASVAAFLILQHADPATQERYLPLLRQAAGRGELFPGMLAMLEDRVRMHRGEPQLYGTQLRENREAGRMELWTIEDEARVDARRASVGLPPLAEYLRMMGIEYTPPTPAP